MEFVPVFPNEFFSQNGQALTISHQLLATTSREIWQRRAAEVSDLVGGGEVHGVLLVSWLVCIIVQYASSYWMPEKSLQRLFRPALTRTSAVLEILSQVARLCALVFAVAGYFDHHLAIDVQRTTDNLPECALLLSIFALGLVRVTILPDISPWRTRLLHHINTILVVELVLLGTGNLVPLLILDTSFQIPRFTVFKLISIVGAILIACITPRRWRAPAVSFELLHRDPQAGPSPEETCSWFSFLSFEWLTKTITKGSRKVLDDDDLLPLPYYDEPLIWLDNILRARSRWRWTFRTMAQVLRWELSRMILAASIASVTEFIAPAAMYALLHYLEAPGDAILNPLCWVGLLFVGPMCQSAALQQYLFASTRLIVRTRLSLIQELYRKALSSVNFDASVTESGIKVDKEATLDAKASKNGHIQSLMSFDVDALYGSRDLVYVSVSTPIKIGLAVLILYKLLSWASIVGLVILLCSFPLATFLSRKLSQAQKRVMVAADKRIGLISEYLASIRTIKYFAWEEAMTKNIEDARAEEQKWIWRRNLYSMAVMVSGDFTPLFTLFITFMTYTLGTGHQLSAAVAFTSLSVIETLRAQFVWISNVTRFWAQGSIACQRLDRYFDTSIECQRHPPGPPAFKNATFRRTPVSEFRLHNLNVEFLEGKLNIIMGPSASGKSSLLLSLIGETILEAGDASCPRDVAYASQSAWLFNDTIRGNILFYQELDQARYDAVLFACGLDHDLAAMEDGDLTKVGDNGSTLSGGQRQRIALARCVYAQSSLLLLDDIFSALDVETSAHVWKNVFCGELLKDRTIILVTQQQWLSDEADLAVTMQAGEIMSTQRHDHTSRVRTPQELHVDRQSIPHISALPPTITSKPVNSKLSAMKQELATAQRNERTLFYQYMYLFGGHSYAIFIITIAFLAQIAFFAITLWLSVWVGQYSTDQATNVAYYLAIYGGILFVFAMLSISKDLAFRWGAWNAAKICHSRLLNSIMAVSLDWFDVNPAGRVINRFAQDMTSVDANCVDYLRATVDNVLKLILRIGGVATIMPIFALPAAIVCGIGFWVGELYTRCQIPAKKMMSASNSPIFSQFQDTMSGLSVIRARGMEDVFGDMLARKMRTYAQAAETCFNLNRWVSIRADACAASVALMAGLLAIYKSDSVSAGLVGFSLSNAIGLSATILMLVRNMNELEIELNCFHRVREYASLPAEEPQDFVSTGRSDDSARDEPMIEFRNVTARYTDDGPDILKNVSFKIKAGERIAIVGRTGSGKSTTVLCLLRFVHVTSGKIFIDGLDISQIALHDLRKEVTMIPQEPVLFSGTVRSNLDPTNTLNRAIVEHSLHSCSSISAIAAPHKPIDPETTTLIDESASSSAVAPEYPVRKESRITLETHISPRGDNLSQGERQILGVARAVARQSKIVLMDEATASVDYESDKTIQEVLKREFAGKTVVTIAHRLMGIIDYDRIFVMGGGELLESGTPVELYRKGGVFKEMVLQSAEVEDLRAILET